MDYKYVEILWEDHQSGSEWTTQNEIKEGKLPVMKTRGWVVHETDKHIVIVHTMDIIYTKVVLGDLWIIKSCIIGIKEL